MTIQTTARTNGGRRIAWYLQELHSIAECFDLALKHDGEYAAWLRDCAMTYAVRARNLARWSGAD